MSSDNKHISYNATDIEKYLAGKLSPLQMHAMEKAALDDPFLAEAMEGYEGMNDSSWKNQLTALHEEIAAKGAVAKVIPLHKTKNEWWKKAAAAVLIIGAGATLTFILRNDKVEADNDAPQIAQTISAAKDSVGFSQQTESEAVGNDAVTISVNPNASNTKEDIAKNIPPATLSATTDDFTIQPGAPVVKASEPAKPILNNNDAEGKSTPVAAPVNNAAGNNNGLLAEETVSESKKQVVKAADEKSRQRNESAASSKSEAALNNFFTAQVVSADNSPLPFTNISIRKDNFGTYADAKGMVRLVSTDSILTVEVKSVGYQPKTYMLRNNQSQAKIILQEEEFAAKDKRVIGDMSAASSQKSRRATLLIDSVVNVEPADGWDNYRTYVANNLDIPDEMLKRDIKGEVELTFDVKENGTISNIRVNKSMGAAYDEAAKRLIQQGPQWKVKKGKKTSAVVKLQF